VARPFTEPPPARPEAVLPVPDRTPPWPAWMGPVALVAALIATTILTAIALAVIGAFGVDVSDPNHGGVAIALTYVQDAAFIATVLVLARLGSRRARLSDLGLRIPALGTTARWVGIAIAAYFVFSIAFSNVVNPKQDNLFDSLHVHRDAAGTVAALAVLVCVLAPIAEELLFRGFMFAALLSWRGPWVAAVIVGLLFGGIHVIGTPALLLIQLAVLGFLFCLVRWKTGSILPTVALHAINNSLAFANLEGWTWQTVPLLIGSAGIALAVLTPFARWDWRTRRSLA
jgi:membrane protease YdiL (CAAX protease family)